MTFRRSFASLLVDAGERIVDLNVTVDGKQHRLYDISTTQKHNTATKY